MIGDRIDRMAIGVRLSGRLFNNEPGKCGVDFHPSRASMDVDGCTSGKWMTVDALSRPMACTGSLAEYLGLSADGLKLSSSTLGDVKKGFSFGSDRMAGDGAGDCDQGDVMACSYSS